MNITQIDWGDKDMLVRCLLACERSEEMKAFLFDLLTPKEIEEFSHRLQAAEMLLAGDSYTKIAETIKMSSATTARVSRMIKNSDGGYRKIVKRVRDTSEKAAQEYQDQDSA